MTTSAVVMMLVAMAILWGGLGLAIWNLNHHDSQIEPPPGRDL